MKLVSKKVSLKEIKRMAEDKFGDLVKTVVDIDKKIMAVDGELHSDEEALLLSKGSKQENLWGINLYPELGGEDFVEFDSMINVKPSFGNASRGVDDPKVRAKIIKIVENLIER